MMFFWSFFPGDFWISRWVVLWVIVAIGIGYRMSGRFKFWGVLVGYVLASAAIRFYSAPTTDINESLQFWPMFDALNILSVIAVCHLFPGKLKRWLAWGAVGNAILTIYQFANGTPWGLFGNNSVNGTFLAMTAFMLPAGSPWMFPLVCAGAVLSKSSMAVGVLAVSLLTFGVTKKSWQSVAVLVLVGLVGFHFAGYDDNGRLTLWRLAVDKWWNHGGTIFGFGVGSVDPIMEKIQNATGFALWRSDGMTTGYFSTLHNEFVSMLFEGGAIGLVLLLAALYFSFLRVLKNKQIAPAFMGAVAALCGQSVFHWSPLTLPFALIIMEVYDDTKNRCRLYEKIV